MADNTITSAFNQLGTSGQNVGTDKSILDKDDFLKLLLVELQNQDPTNPQETDKILQQTSELATLEASTNTNKALENLSSSLSSSAQFATLNSIGKMVSTGETSLTLEGGTAIDFDIYLPENVESGEITIYNDQNIAVDFISMGTLSKGTNSFLWDATNKAGESFEDGEYTIEASYLTTDGKTGVAKYGVYPIEAVRFTSGEAEFKIGSRYIPMTSAQEIYNGGES
jgi:flagellar basal-body rod modification protein FlgD